MIALASSDTSAWCALVSGRRIGDADMPDRPREGFRMGQAAVVDQPDVAGAAPTKIDEELARLAGEEVDRLLAAVEDGDDPAVAAPMSPEAIAAMAARAVLPSPPEVTPEPEPEPEPIASSAEPVIAEVAASEVAAPAENATTPTAAESAVAESLPDDAEKKRLETLAAELELDEPKAEKTEIVPAASTALAAPAELASAPPAEQTPVEAKKTEAETPAAPQKIAAPAKPAAEAKPAVQSKPIKEPKKREATPVPLFLLPLVWINAPFTACPEWMRRLAGIAAVAALFNALVGIGFYLWRLHP
jgi:hypothetical protein